ncbi:hypothetical protein B7486_76730, partial [cyanobacterium TDX16]
MKDLLRWPPRPSTIALAAVLAFGVVGGGLLVWGVLDSPKVPDSAIPVPRGAEVVGDISLPESSSGGSQASATNRTVSIADAELDAAQLFEAVVAELEDAGWQLGPGTLGPGQVVSTQPLDDEYELDARLRTGEDGAPPGVRSP